MPDYTGIRPKLHGPGRAAARLPHRVGRGSRPSRSREPARHRESRASPRRSPSVTTPPRSPKVAAMRTPLIAALAALVLAVSVTGCSKQETPPPPTPAPASARQSRAHRRCRAHRNRAGRRPRAVPRVRQRARPALVFIHGWSCDSNYWREQIPAFRGKYTLVTVDLAGHGGTDAQPHRTGRLRAFGQDVATALSAVPNQQIILVGHSMGGPVALEAARLLNKRVVGIIGVDTFKSIGAPMPTKAQVDADHQTVRGRLHRPDPRAGRRSPVREERQPAACAEDRLRHVAVAPRVAVPSLRALLEYDFTGPLKDISVPIVAINSDLGEPLNEARIRKVLPKFRAVTLAGDGHFLMMEDPQRFNPALEAEVAAMLGAKAPRVTWTRAAIAGPGGGADERAPPRPRAPAHDHAGVRPGVRHSRHEVAFRSRRLVRAGAGLGRHRRRARGRLRDAGGAQPRRPAGRAAAPAQQHRARCARRHGTDRGRPLRFRVQGADAQPRAARRLRRHSAQGRAAQPTRASVHRDRDDRRVRHAHRARRCGCCTSCSTG